MRKKSETKNEHSRQEDGSESSTGVSTIDSVDTAKEAASSSPDCLLGRRFSKTSRIHRAPPCSSHAVREDPPGTPVAVLAEPCRHDDYGDYASDYEEEF